MSGTYTEARARAVKKYLDNIAECRVRVREEDKERYKTAAKKA